MSRLTAQDRLIRQQLGEGRTVADIARELRVPRSTLRDYLASVQEAQEAAPTTTVTSDTPAEWGDIRKLLADNGLNVDEWVVKGSRVNTWGTVEDGVQRTNSQLRVDLAPALAMLVPGRVDEARPVPAPVPRDRGDSPELVAIFGDTHVPHFDEGLHAAACQWLRDHQPDRLVHVGDALDYDAVSRHPDDPEWGATMKATVQAGTDLYHDFRNCLPNGEIVVLDGNHEERLRSAVLKNLRAVHGLTPGQLPTDEKAPLPIFATPFLLRFDDLHIKWVEPHGTYDHALYQIDGTVGAVHGQKLRPDAGASVLSTVKDFGFSIVMGDTHRQAITQLTRWTIDKEPIDLVGMEVGTMARRHGGLGYVKGGRPNWQAGFGVIRVWPDGRKDYSLARWSAGSLTWGDWRCTP